MKYSESLESHDESVNLLKSYLACR